MVIEEGACGCDGSCPEGFECCGGQCCSSGYCAGDICCAFGVCGDTCREDPLQVCCGGVPYIPETHYCCDGVIVEGECCASGGCVEGFECCGGVCCADGYCAGDLCCVTPACAGSCNGDTNYGCCAGQTYDMSVSVCCDDEIIEGNCCVNSDCGTCVFCEDHVCGSERC